MTARGPLPAIVSISSHVARGAVGNRAAVFACQTLGLPVWAVNTVSLPFHPGHGPSTRIEPEPERFSAFLADLLHSPWIGEVGAVLTGYMGSAGQAEATGRVVAELRRRRPGLIHLCDPIVGEPAARALERASASVFECVARAARRGSGELMLATDRGAIARPSASVHLRRVVVPGALVR